MAQTFLKAAATWSSGVVLAKCTVTGNWRASTLITGGGVGKSAALSRKEATDSVADMMTSLSGPTAVASPSPAPASPSPRCSSCC